MTESIISVAEFEWVKVNGVGEIVERNRGSSRCLQEALSSEIGLELMEIPAGRCKLGAPKTEEGWHPSQYPQQEMAIDGFWLGKFPVTQTQWQIVAALPKVNRGLTAEPSCFANPTCPVEQVAWWEAVEFCDRLSVLTGRAYRLPSEAEWEYACRAGMYTPFHFGETITTDLANYSGVNWDYEGRICSQGFYGKGPTGGDRRETTEVGTFAVANAFGLYDMHGLVREWCADGWHPTYDGIPLDGSPWTSSGDHQRVLRGGSWNTSPRTCRSAFRSKADADSHLYDIGFRVACSL